MSKDMTLTLRNCERLLRAPPGYLEKEQTIRPSRAGRWRHNAATMGGIHRHYVGNLLAVICKRGSGMTVGTQFTYERMEG